MLKIILRTYLTAALTLSGAVFLYPYQTAQASDSECLAPISNIEKTVQGISGKARYDTLYQEGIIAYKSEGTFREAIRKIFKNYPNLKVQGLHKLLQSMDGYKKILLETNEFLKKQNLLDPNYYNSDQYRKIITHLEELLSKIENTHMALNQNVPFQENEMDTLLGKINIPAHEIEDMKFHIIRHNQAKIRYGTGELIISRNKPRFSTDWVYTLKYQENLPLSLKNHLHGFRENSRFQKDLIIGGQRSSDRQLILGMGHTNPDTDTVFSSLVGMTYLQAQSLLSGADNRIYMPVIQGAYNEETDYIFDISGIKKDEILKWDDVSTITNSQLKKLTPLKESALQFNDENFSEFITLLNSVCWKRKKTDTFKENLRKEIYSTYEYKRYMTLLRNLFINWKDNLPWLRQIFDPQTMNSLTGFENWYSSGIVDDLEQSNDLQLMNAVKELYQTETSGSELNQYYLERICYNILVGAYPFFHKDTVRNRVERTTADNRLTEIHAILAKKLSEKIKDLKTFTPENLSGSGFLTPSRLWTQLIRCGYIDPNGKVLSPRIDITRFNSDFKKLSRSKRIQLEHLLTQHYAWQNKPELSMLDIGCSDGITTLNMLEKFSSDENLKDIRFNITGADIALDYYVVTDICHNKAFFDAFGNLRQVTISSATGKEKIYSLATPYSFKQLINVFNNMFDSSNIIDIRKHNVISPVVTRKTRDLGNNTLSFIPENLFNPDTQKTYDAVTVFSTLLGNYNDDQIEAALRTLGKTVSKNGGLLMIGGVRVMTKEANYVIYQRKNDKLLLTEIQDQGCGLTSQRQQTLKEIDLTADLGDLKTSVPEVSLIKTEDEMMEYIRKNYLKPHYTDGKKNFSKYTFYFFDHIVNENPELKALLEKEINVETFVSADHHVSAFEKHIGELIKKCRTTLDGYDPLLTEAVNMNLATLKQTLDQLWESEPEQWEILLEEIRGLEIGMKSLLHYLKHEKVSLETQNAYTELLTLVHALTSGRIEKIGATCTKIAENLLKDTPYLLTKDVATSLLSAILSDLKGLESPTTTERDEKIIEVLMRIAGVKNLDTFYNKQKIHASTVKGKTANAIFFSDYKTSYTPEAGLAEKEISGFGELEDPQQGATFTKDELVLQLTPFITRDIKLHEKEIPKIISRILSDLVSFGYLSFSRKNGTYRINEKFLSEQKQAFLNNSLLKSYNTLIMEAVFDYLLKLTKPLIIQGVEVYRDALRYSEKLHFIGATLIDTTTYDSKFLIIGKKKYEKEIEALTETMAAYPDIITALMKSAILKPYFSGKISLYECSEKILSFFQHDIPDSQALLTQIQGIIRKYPVKTPSLYRMAEELYNTLTRQGHKTNVEAIKPHISAVPYNTLKTIQSTVLKSEFTRLAAKLPLKTGQTPDDLTETLFKELTAKGLTIPQSVNLNEYTLTEAFLSTEKENFTLSEPFKSIEKEIYDLLQNSRITVKYINLPGVLSRKKEVAPPIIKFFKNQAAQNKTLELALEAIAENQVSAAA